METALNSKEVTSTESQQHFLKIIDFLITELAGDNFDLETNISDNGNFRISISGLPNRNKKTYRINYDISLFRMIYDVLYVVLSNNNFFTSIGKSSNTFSIPTIEVPNWALLDAAMASNEPILFDEERKELHSYIYTLCLHFIVRHEIRHIANGHIDYLVNRQTNEFVEGFANGLSPMDSQTIEMDVDSCVTAGFLNGFLNIPEQLKHIPIKLHGYESMFESLLFALKILFYCLPSKKVSNIKEAQNLSHPNSAMRYFYSFTAGLSFLQESNPELFEVFGKTYQRTWSFFEILAEQGILNPEKVWQDYNWSMSDEGQEYANTIWNNWNKWIPQLEPYTFLKLAPPEN
jgi:hypothetical protein